MTNLIKTISLSNGYRKYTKLWKTIIENGAKPTLVKCERKDTVTIMGGVKKEKLHDKRKPEKKILKCEPTEFGIEFRLEDDNSINSI